MLVGTVACVEHGHHVAGHADMACGIAAVGGDGHFQRIVLFQMEILLGGHAHGGVVGQHHDAGVIGTQLQLIGSAEHSLAHRTAQFAFLNLIKLRVGSVNLGANLCTHNFLSGSHVGGSAHNVEGCAGTHVHGGEMQVVAVGVGLAGEHLGYHHVLQSAFDAFYLLHVFNLQSAEGQQVVKFVGGEVCIDILTQPFVRYFHYDVFLFFQYV